MRNHEAGKSQRSRKTTNHTTDARATAQRAKLDAQTEAITQETAGPTSAGKPKRKKEPQRMFSNRLPPS